MTMQFQTPNTRRSFLKRSGMGFGSIALNSLLSKDSLAAQQAETHFPGKAKHVIHVFLNGGMSQVDTFDPKPALEKWHGREIPVFKKEHAFFGETKATAMRSPYTFKKNGQSGINISEKYPYLARHADDLCIIRSKRNNLAGSPDFL